MLRDAARSLGANRWQVLTEVLLPGALPNVITGLRNGLGYGWRALIVAEIIGTSGIGFMMFDARRSGSVVEMILGMILLGILWYAVDAWVLTFQRFGRVSGTRDNAVEVRSVPLERVRQISRFYWVLRIVPLQEDLRL